MNPIKQVIVREHKFEGPEVTFAGPDTRGGICFGFEDGSIEGSNIPRMMVSPAGEAVNGIGIINEHLAVSTRADVTFLDMGKSVYDRSTSYVGGAHGVIATKSGFFLAPLGPNGLLRLRPSNDRDQEFDVTVGKNHRRYYSRLSVVNAPNEGEIVLLASRRDGFGTMVFDAEMKGRVQTQTIEGLDVIDVCGVRNGVSAAIALTSNAEFMLFRDALSEDPPLFFSLGSVEGVVFRTLVANRHLILLTNKALYIWLDFLTSALEGKPDFSIEPVVLLMDAVDINLLDNESLLIVMASNAVSLIRLDELADRNAFPQTSRRIWITEPQPDNLPGKIFSETWKNAKITNEFLVGTS